MAHNDFNGDGRSDILWLRIGDALFETVVGASNWLGTAAGGFTINDSNALKPLSPMPQSRFEATGDFNGDGRTDVMWRSVNGDHYYVWQAGQNGSFPNATATPSFTVGDPNWRMAATGDFNGDGKDDILWRNADGTISDWLGNSGGSFTINDAHAMTSVPNTWFVIGSGDFNGDGKSDILWHSNDGRISTWLGNSSGGFDINDAHALTAFAGQVLAIGDFNGDGRDDVISNDGAGHLDVMAAKADGSLDVNGITAFTNQIPNWSIAGVGDYNGDGTDDLLWRSSSGAISDWLGVPGTSPIHFTINDAHAFTSVSDFNWWVA